MRYSVLGVTLAGRMLRRHTFAHRATTDRIAALPRSADRLCLLTARQTARDRNFEAAAGPGQRIFKAGCPHAAVFK